MAADALAPCVARSSAAILSVNRSLISKFSTTRVYEPPWLQQVLGWGAVCASIQSERPNALSFWQQLQHDIYAIAKKPTSLIKSFWHGTGLWAVCNELLAWNSDQDKYCSTDTSYASSYHDSYTEIEGMFPCTSWWHFVQYKSMMACLQDLACCKALRPSLQHWSGKADSWGLIYHHMRNLLIKWMLSHSKPFFQKDALLEYVLHVAVLFLRL